MATASQHATPLALVRGMVEAHRRNSPQLNLELALWLNAHEDPWACGVELVEVYQVMPINDPPDFRPIEWAPRQGWPRLRLIPTSLREINLELEIVGRAHSFYQRVRRRLRNGTARMIYPQVRGAVDQVAVFDDLLGPGA